MFYSVYTVMDFFNRKILPGFKIAPDKLVIDIGSGDKPFWRGDVFFDNLKLDNRQRISGKKTVHDLGLFIDGDITKTNFKDKVFDFAFCSHLIEHVEKPELVIKEITRIAKKGYLETPNGLIEAIKPFHSHLWFIYYIDNKLIFIRKSKELHDILTKNGIPYHQTITKIKNPFIRIYWEDSINFEVIRNPKQIKDFKVQSLQRDEHSETPNYYVTLIRLFRTFFYTPKKINRRKLLK